MNTSTRIALVHDYWVTLRGGERVFLALKRLLPDADCYTLIQRKNVLPAGHAPLTLHSTPLNWIPGGARHYRSLLPLYPLAAAQLDLTQYDLVLSSSSGFSHGVRTAGAHICYCHTPLRYAWHDYSATVSGLRSPALRAAYGAVMGYIRQLDYEAAQRVTTYVANSAAVQQRIADYYDRRSTIVHPFVDTRRFQPGGTSEGYFLVVSQLNTYKRVDLAIEACNRLGRRLVIVGAGPERARLERLAGPTVSFLDRVSEEQLPKLYANCAALLQCGEEDFGIAALEAQASGRPVLAYGASGALETVIAGETGLHIPEQTADAVTETIRAFDDRDFDSARVRRHAEQFDEAHFRARMLQVIASSLGEAPRPMLASLPVMAADGHTTPARAEVLHG